MPARISARYVRHFDASDLLVMGLDPGVTRTPYHPPVKRSVEIAGHKTSISLEPLFWDLLKAAATAESLPLNALVARIDAERLGVSAPPGLASAIRLWLTMRLQAAEREPG